MSVLTENSLEEMIRKQRIILTPLLDLDRQVSNGSIDVRLGTDFILMQRTQYPLLDPPKVSLDEINKFQMKQHLSFGDRFILHPEQFVLASTFEYIHLPEDLCAYVTSRSRYGRLGLLIATAIYVHPLWTGRLTLELFNYGEAPIVLYCGALIAQLVLQKADPPLKKKDPAKQSLFPIGPEFSIIDKDPDWEKLKRFNPKIGGDSEL